MANRVRTLDFLPEIFKTTANEQFLSATLDQLTQQSNTERIEGYIGSKFGYGVNANDKYVVEPTKVRTDYQLDPAVVFLKKDTSVAVDFLTYPGLVDGIRNQNGFVKNHNSLFENEFYSWDSLANLDKLINFGQYYWLPDGPSAVTITTDTLYNNIAYTVQSSPLVYSLSADKVDIEGGNPTISLLRGGTYTFAVNQDTEFWIQGAPGVDGTDPFKTNLNTRDVSGVENNGAKVGLVTFTVPARSSQDYLNYTGGTQVDLVTTKQFSDINGKRLSELGGSIDGITSLNNRTLMFYGTQPGIQGYIGDFFGVDTFDTDGSLYASPITATATSISSNAITLSSTTGLQVDEAITFSGVEFGGISSSTTYYIKTIVGNTITLSATPAGTTVTLTNASGSMVATTNRGMFEEGIYTGINETFYKINVSNELDPVIVLTVSGTIPTEQKISVTYGTEWIGRNFFRTPEGNIELIPFLSAQLDTLYYQDGSVPGKFGKINIVEDNNSNAIDVDSDIIGKLTYISPNGVTLSNGMKVIFSGDVFPEKYKQGEFYVEGVGKSIELIPVSELIVPEVFTEGEYTPFDVETFDLQNFDTTLYIPMVKDYITIARNSIDRNAWSRSNRWFHVDVIRATAGYNNDTDLLTVLNSGDARAQRPIIEFYPNMRLFNNGVVGKNPIDFIDFTATDALVEVSGSITYYPDGLGTPLFDGARIVFANDNNPEIRNKIFVANIEKVDDASDPVITLSRSVSGDINIDDQVVVFKGENGAGKSYWYDGSTWTLAQIKTLINQPPLFDIFDGNDISLGDKTVYQGSSFAGCKVLSYGIGTGSNDPVLGFPVRYSSVTNVGDLSFDVNLNLDTFSYVENNIPVTKNVSLGYVHQYTDRLNYVLKTGWETAAAPSIQYQVYNLVANLEGVYVCDVAAKQDSTWPSIQMYVNNTRIDPTEFTSTIDATTTTINYSGAEVGQPIEILIYSDQVSDVAYYEIPRNLANNPFNSPLTETSVGEVRGHYQSIYKNFPGISGPSFGANNYRDLGDLVPYGTRIIQNSAPLVLPSVFIRNTNHNLYDALTFNANEYTKFKSLLLDTVNRQAYAVQTTPADMLDNALDQLASVKSNSASFFWTDMVPTGSSYLTRTYSFMNFRDSSIFQLSKIYDFETANYNGVLVYLNTVVDGVIRSELLLNNIDYVISKDTSALTVTRDLTVGDTIVIKEYNQTYGSYVPNTPTKIGLYPLFVPEIVYDTSYVTPTYFIKGHDGSMTKLYGAYNNGLLEDYRDKVLFEFEKRIFNNMKVNAQLPLQRDDIFPGQFRTTDFEYQDILDVYSYGFLDWVGKNRIDYKSQYFSSLNQFTWNYNLCTDKLNDKQILQGNWRGAYIWLYDTDRPHTAPWEMIGYSIKPTWWEARYGSAPYTSDNTVLWNDLADGIDWNNGNPVVIDSKVRPNLLDILPVDSMGNLVSPFTSIVQDFDSNTINRDWKVGDVGPAESAYLKSSTWPFDLVKMFAICKPVKLYNLGVDLDRYKYDSTIGQYLFDHRYHITPSDVDVYGSGTAKHSYINWIVDYQKQYGIDATQQITDLLDNLDVRLTYRVAGFSDKDMLKFYVEKGTPNSKNTSLLIPDESYGLILYQNQPVDTVTYSSVIVQKTTNGYTVWGNSQNKAYFKVAMPKNNGMYENITVGNVTVKVNKDFYDKTAIVHYGTEFTSVQALAEFLNSYGALLATQGFVFDTIEQGVEINWYQIIAEAMYWIQTGWEVGSTINVNPAAKQVKFDKDSLIVQPLTLQQQNFILNQNLIPVQVKDMCVHRNGTEFTAQMMNEADTVSYFNANVSNMEHAVVFDNTTLFGDVIYRLVSGLRQQRVTVKGIKTAEWNGAVDAQGFILNQDNVIEWQPNVRYTKGVIVKYKNSYWTSTQIVQPSATFDQTKWTVTDYASIQKGLLPNPSQRSYESTLYYDVNRTNLENDADVLGFSLIGYRPRDYLADANLSDITQVNVYKNLIRSKGTSTSANSFKNSTLPQGAIDYDVYENWAIKTSEFGGILNNNFIEVDLDSNKLTGNPGILSLTSGLATDGAQQEVPMYNIRNYGRSVTSVDVLPTISSSVYSKLPDAGYVNFNDVKINSYSFNNLPVNPVTLSNLYKNDYVWLADYKGSWNVFTPVALGIYDGTTCNAGTQVIQVSNNLNGTASVKFNTNHGLVKDQPIMIVNFDVRVDGYYIVTDIIDINTIVIGLSLDPSVKTITGSGIAAEFVSQRVESPRDIVNLPAINSEFVNETVWVDEGSTGVWNVLRKSTNYLSYPSTSEAGTSAYGTSVAVIPGIGYLSSDPANGKVYQIGYDGVSDSYTVQSTITQGSGFGTGIAYNNNIVAITSPSESKVYLYEVIQWGNISTLNPQAVLTSVTHTGPVSISGDGNWIFLGDANNNLVRTYSRRLNPSYTSTSLALSVGIASGDTTFIVDGNQTSSLTTGTKVAFSNTSYTPVYEVTTGVYDTTQLSSVNNLNAATNIVTLYDANLDIAVGDAITFTWDEDVLPLFSYSGIVAGTTYYIKAFTAGDKSAFTLSETKGGSEFNITPLPPIMGGGSAYTASVGQATFNRSRTVFGVQNEIATSYLSSSTVYTAVLTYTSGGTFAAASLSSGDAFGASIGSNYDGSKIVVGAPTQNYSVSLTDVGYGYVFDRIVENIEVQSNSYPDINTEFVLATEYTSIPHVWVNGGLLTPTIDYTTASVTIDGTNYTKLTMIVDLSAGDIINVGTATFVQQQKLQSYTDIATVNAGANFGKSVDTTVTGGEILVGAPFDLSDTNQEGAVYRFTNGGKRYGIITGSTAVTPLVSAKTVLINGYKTILPAGDAETIAGAIATQNIPNVTASANAGILTISLIDNSINPVNNKLTLSVFDGAVLTSLGITPYTQTQVIQSIHSQGTTQFGYSVKYNEHGSFVVGAPVAIRFNRTTFDFTNDSNNSNDTVFDNNFTQWVDGYANAGAAYVYDYIAAGNGTITNPGKYIFAQSIVTDDTNYGSQPMFGYAVAFKGYSTIIGAPRCLSGDGVGCAYVFDNTVNQPCWSVYRSSSEIVDVNRIQSVQMFDNISNDNLGMLDYIDPLQGKLLGAVRENIDVISSVDPAGYNNSETINKSTLVWGKEQVGNIWLNTSRIRFVNYHQNDVVYNSKYWGTVFPGSSVAAYTWIESGVLPAFYQGEGQPFDLSSYTMLYDSDASGQLVQRYFYWVRNTNTISANKSLSDSIIEEYVANPQSSGISYFAGLLPNTFGLYNSQEYINHAGAALHVGYSTGNNDDSGHVEFDLIRQNYADDFLPGIPTRATNEPQGLYKKLIDSLSGVDDTGAVVPDVTLPSAVRYGINSRPRQSMFVNRFKALENYFTYANDILAQYPISEFREPAFLTTSGEYFDTTAYWNYVNWWATGYSDTTKSAFEVPKYYDLQTVSASEGLIVTVSQNSDGKREVYHYTNGDWVRIGLERGTIELDSKLWDYNTQREGFGDNFFDNVDYDQYPSVETRYIIRALNEEIYTNELLIHRNKSLVLLFEYIQSEHNNSQLPWLNKTSFVDVSHTIRELKPYEKFQRDNQTFLSGYLNEVKPYHVIIKDFQLKYTGTDVFDGNVSDFDLPARYDSTLEKFISPQLVYNTASGDSQYSYDDPIWQTSVYNDWYQVAGLSVTGVNNFMLGKVARYISTVDTEMYIDNSYGYPVTGIITIDGETIAYTGIDRHTGKLTGMSRGVYNTPVTPHNPGTPIYIDLSGATVLDTGRGYIDPPKVTAWIDTSIYPAPKREARFSAVMSGDRVVAVDVVDPGLGYAVQPEIIIEPSATITFSGTQVSVEDNLISLTGVVFQTGDLIRYEQDGNNVIGGLLDHAYYYVGVVQETLESQIIALYVSTVDAVSDTHRVRITSTSTGTTNQLIMTARVSCVTTTTPVRQTKTIMKFDRTTYGSQVTPWTPGTFYSGPVENVTETTSSSGTLLYESLEFPNVVGTSSPLHGNPVLEYVISDTDIITNGLTLASGDTSHMTINTMIMFTGSVFGGIEANSIYYIKAILSDTAFSVTRSPYGATVQLSTASGTMGARMTPAVFDAFILTTDFYKGRGVGTGTIATTSSSPTVIGTSTAFTSQLEVGMLLKVSGATLGVVSEIIDDETLTLASNAAVVAPVKSFTYGPQGTITTSTSGTTVTGSGTNFSTQLNAGMHIYDISGTSIGIIDTITNDTTLVLTENAQVAVSASEYGYGRGVYGITVRTAGEGYAVDDVITIPGSNVNSGTSDNNLTVTVTAVGSLGEINTVSVSGTPNINMNMVHIISSINGVLPIQAVDTSGSTVSLTVDYTNANVSPGQINKHKVKLYQTPNFTSRVTPSRVESWVTGTGATFDIYSPYFSPTNILQTYGINIVDAGSGYYDGTDGINQASVMYIDGATVGGVTGVNDVKITVMLTGSLGEIIQAVATGVAHNEIAEYYIKSINENTIELYNNSTFTSPVDTSSFTFIAGDLAYLPQPLYVDPSIVTYQGRTYVCSVSNNDSTFDYTKWTQIYSSDERLNALDRIMAFYEPTANMPGKDLTQLVRGISYPYNTYLGNPFSPEDELTLDTILTDQPFYPIDIDIKGVVWDGNRYVGIADTPQYSVTVISEDGVTWSINRISDQVLNVTGITFNGSQYMLTANNQATPLILSNDAINWVSKGPFTPYDRTDYADTAFDSSSIIVPSDYLNSSISYDGYQYAVGNNIIRTNNGYDWEQVYSFGTRFERRLNDIAHISSIYYRGFVAVGFGQEYSSGSGTAAPTLSDISVVLTSIDGNTWTTIPTITSYSLNAITVGDNRIVVVGDNATVYHSLNGSNWSAATISGSAVTSQLNGVAYGNSVFVAAGAAGTLLKSSDGITWTQLTSSSITTENLNSVVWTGTQFMIVGDNDVILTSADGTTWTADTVLSTNDTTYYVQGPTFMSGYGPEELVSGVVTDDISMYVKTRPGAAWPATGYQHNGFGMKSVTMTVPADRILSFADIAETPALLSVFLMNGNNTGSRIYEGITVTATNPYTYTVNWNQKTITFNSAITVGSTVMVEVYEIGNGNQLARTTTDITPVRLVDGSSTIFLDYVYNPGVYASPVVYKNGSKLVFNTDYSLQSTEEGLTKVVFTTLLSDTDFVSLATFGELFPQSGYAIPETQTFLYSGSGTFALTNTMGATNIANAVVEKNGVRLVKTTDYSITGTTLTVTASLTTNDIISVTSYGDTTEQALVTDTFNGKTVANITYVDNATTPVTVLTGIPHGLTTGDQVRIDGLVGSTQLNNNVYYVVVNTTTSISLCTSYTSPTVNTPVAGGGIGAYVSGGFVWKEGTFTLTNSYDLTDADRIWVTVDGRRINSDQLVFNEDNKLSILSTIDSSSTSKSVVITSMTPSATPNELIYRLSVDRTNVQEVYRVTPNSKTWLTQPFYSIDTTIHVNDVTHLVDNVEQYNTVKLEDGLLKVGIVADRRNIVSIDVYDAATGTKINSSQYEMNLESLAPVLTFFGGVTVGQLLRIVVRAGNVLIINGEKIKFRSVDYVNNTITGLLRGVDGTSAADFHDTYETVYSVLPANKMNNVYYYENWNSSDYSTMGDPLQISSTSGALFLRGITNS